LPLGGTNGANQMKRFKGLSLSPGLASGKAFVYKDILQRDQERYDILEEELEEELSRMDKAIEQVLRDLDDAAERVERKIDKEHADIYLAQKEILRDPSLLRQLKDNLKGELVNAERVVQRVFHRMERKLRQVNDEVSSARGDDVADLGRRLLRALVGIHVHALESIPRGSIVVARRLLPSDTAVLSRKSAAGVALEMGGVASHAAILTREMGVPAVSGIQGILERISEGDSLLLDGDAGEVVLSPSEEAMRAFQDKEKERSLYLERLRERCHEPAVTKRGVRVAVLANIGCREDAEMAAKLGADGVGLYRIEAAYLSRKELPTEGELYETLRDSLEPMADKPLTVRLLDIGGDKDMQFLGATASRSLLGRRGVRLLLDFPDLLSCQLRVLVRLSTEFQLRVLVPMVTLVEDVVRVRERLREVSLDLGLRSCPPIGAMVETPAAALCADRLAKESDFLSVGTNDLTQYCMAAGREEVLVTKYYVDDHPAVMKLLRNTVEEAGGTPVSLCGELAGHPESIELLIGMGLRSLSVVPSHVPLVKATVRKL